MPAFPPLRNHKALTGSLASGFFLLLASLFGPFVLRNFERRRWTFNPINPIRHEEKRCVSDPSGDLPLAPSVPEAQLPGGIPEFREPLQLLEELNAFISQLPPPTLAFSNGTSGLQPPAAMLASAPAEGEEAAGRQQRIYTDVSPTTGEARAVLEQHHDFGGGMRWRRKLVVYPAGGGR